MTQDDYRFIAELLAAHRLQINERAHWLLCANFANALGMQDPNGFDFERFVQDCKAHFAF